MSVTTDQITAAVAAWDVKASRANRGQKPYPKPENSFIEILLYGDKQETGHPHEVQLKVGLAKHLKTIVKGTEIRLFFTLDSKETIYCMVGYSDESIHEQWFRKEVLEVNISTDTGVYVLSK